MIFELLELTKPLMLFDLETTGVDPATARIVQIGLRVYRPNVTSYDFHSLVNPEVPIPAEATNAHGITQFMIEFGCAKCRREEKDHPHEKCEKWFPVPRFKDLLPNLYEKGFKICDFAGYNHKAFDLRVMEAEFQRHGITFDYSGAAILDGVRFWQHLEPRTLSDAVERWAGRKHVDAHDAMADVLGTEAALVGQLKTGRLPTTPREIHDLLYPKAANHVDEARKFILIDGKVCFNFGKNKNKPLTAFPSYVDWMIDKGDFPAETKRIAREVVDGVYMSGSVDSTQEPG